MTITIDNKVALLKKGSSFDFVSENRQFSGADSYTLAITFPLKNCPQNTAIFGHISRKDVEKKQLLFSCEIRDGKFCKRGSITITELTDVEVKTQFLEGRSVSNFVNTFDDVYINEMELGYPNTAASSFPMDMNNWVDSYGTKYVALPWVNNSSGNVQNDMNLAMGGATWKSTTLSFQPYMLYIVKQICTKLGYSFDFTEWERSNYKYLLICNALPAAWELHNFAKALPHWTITELLEQLEYLMNCEFDIDHNKKYVRMAFTRTLIENCEDVELKQVIDDYQMEKVDVGDCKYRGACNLKYADCDHRMWKYYVNPTFIQFWLDKYLERGSLYREVDNVEVVAEMARRNEWEKVENPVTGAISRLYYCKEEDRYLIVRVIQFEKLGSSNFEGEQVPFGYYHTIGQFVNTFAPRMVHPDADTKELKIVPAWIDDTDVAKGQCIFLQLPDYENAKAARPHNGFDNWDEAMAHLAPEPDYFIKELQENYLKEDEEYLDKIYVGFYPGGGLFDTYRHPYIDVVDFNHTWWPEHLGWSLALNSDTFNQYTIEGKIDPTQKYTFKFLADDVPNARSVFIIHGQRYLCEKITATFTEHGMSKMMKGVFYKLL